MTIVILIYFALGMFAAFSVGYSLENNRAVNKAYPDYKKLKEFKELYDSMKIPDFKNQKEHETDS